eukprot:3210777-Rhodomonas_salina.5
MLLSRSPRLGLDLWGLHAEGPAHRTLLVEVTLVPPGALSVLKQIGFRAGQRAFSTGHRVRDQND